MHFHAHVVREDQIVPRRVENVSHAQSDFGDKISIGGSIDNVVHCAVECLGSIIEMHDFAPRLVIPEFFY